MKRSLLLLPVILLSVNVCQALDSLNFRSIGAEDIWATGRTLVTRNGYAYVGTDGEDVRILNIGRADHPFEVARYPVANVKDIAFLGENAIFAAGEGGWEVVNFHTPNDPFYMSRVREDNINAVATKGVYALIGTEDGKVMSYNLNDPTTPDLRSTVERLSSVRRIVIRDTIAFVATLNGLVTLDLGNLAEINFISRWNLRGHHTDLALNGNCAYMIETPDTLNIFNIAAPEQMNRVWQMKLEHPASRLVVQGRYIYLGSEVSQGFNVLDVWDIDTPDTVQFINSGWGASALTISDGRLWTTEKGLTGYSLVEPQLPVQVGHIGYNANIVDLKIVGGNLYALGDAGEVIEADVSNRATPTARNGLSYSAERWGTRPDFQPISAFYGLVCGEKEITALRPFENYIDTSLAYQAGEDEQLIEAFADNGRLVVAAGESGLLDFSYNPAEFSGELAFEGNHQTRFPAQSITGFGWPGIAIACRSERGDSVEVIYNTGENIKLTLQVPRGGRTVLRASPEALCLAAGDFYTIGYDEEETLSLLGHYQPDSAVQDMAVAGDFAAILEGSHRITILNITNPAHPFVTGFFNNCVALNCLEFSGQFLYAGGVSEYRIFDVARSLRVDESHLTLPTTIQLNAFPNPFNSQATISYSLPSPGRYVIDVIDIQGRLVTRLSDGWREAGSYREVLNGRQIASGQYLLLLNSDREAVTKNLSLIK